ncbi:MAG TPA: glycosyltransferase family 2 protein [Acidimicrobiia bacterium]
MGNVILPALDEARAIPEVLAGIPDGWAPIVVDNGSIDGSADVARQHGALVVTEARRGFGAACHAGLSAATEDLVAFMDCDGSFSGTDLDRVAARVRAGDADLVLGARNPDPGSGAWPWHLRVANRTLARSVRRRTGVALHDLGPMRVARREPLVALGIRDRRFGWPLEMVLRAAEAGWRIDEIPVAYRPRVGRSKVTGTVRGVVRTVHDMRVALR